MSAIVPFNFQAPAAERTRRRERSINEDAIIHSAGYPSISIRGKVFAVVQGDAREPLMREVDGDMMPVAALRLAVVRANARHRVFYAKSYTADGEDGGKPVCFSHDGQRPDPKVDQPQASNCQLCPHAQWDSKVSSDGAEVKGTACTVRTRLAVVNPRAQEMKVMLLNVPAGSRAGFSKAVQLADQHGKDYNEVVFKVAFDQEAASPKLVFTPEGILSDELYDKLTAMYDEPAVRDIVGVPSIAPAPVVRDVAPALEAPAPKPAPKPAATSALLSDDDIDDIPPKAAPAVRGAPKAAPAAALLTDDEVDAPAKAAPKPRTARAKPAVEPETADAAPAKPKAAADAQSIVAGLSDLLDMTDD